MLRLLNRFLIVLVIFLPSLLGLSTSSSADDKSAINNQFHISISYPDSWALIPLGAPNEVFRLWSSHGKGVPGCTVAANDTKIRTNTDKSIVEVYRLMPQVMEGRLLDGYKDPNVIDRKITTLSNLEAISIISSGTYSTLGNAYRIKMWSLITQKTGIIYTITCADSDDHFQVSLPVFRKILASFLIFP